MNIDINVSDLFKIEDSTLLILRRKRNECGIFCGLDTIVCARIIGSDAPVTLLREKNTHDVHSVGGNSFFAGVGGLCFCLSGHNFKINKLK